jgi:uncharacterized protein DUF4157
MRLLAGKTDRSRAPHLSRVVPSRGATRAPVEREHPVLRLQHTIGNQAAQRMVRSEFSLPPLVHDVLAGSGEAFDTSTRTSMERGFGHELGHVRVHTDAEAAASARAIDALAYTAGHHIVFGAGQYAPHTPAGRRLLAHELTHVVQQAPPGTIRRQPVPGKTEKANDARLQILAENPMQAHEAWARLNEVERTSVVVRMGVRYGKDFANSFLWFTKNPKQRRLHSEGTNVSYRSHDWYKARGYRLRTTSQGTGRDDVLEFWVHPSGHCIDQVVSKPTRVSGPPGPQVPPGPITPPQDVDCTEVAGLMVSILDGAIATETDVQKELEADKGKLEKLNKTLESYCPQFEQYEADLKAMSTRVESDVDDIEAMRDLLVEGKCSVPAGVDTKLDELRDFGIWADVESSPMSTQFLQCLKIPGPKGMPGDDDDS